MSPEFFLVTRCQLCWQAVFCRVCHPTIPAVHIRPKMVRFFVRNWGISPPYPLIFSGKNSEKMILKKKYFHFALFFTPTLLVQYLLCCLNTLDNSEILYSSFVFPVLINEDSLNLRSNLLL